MGTTEGQYSYFDTAATKRIGIGRFTEEWQDDIRQEVSPPFPNAVLTDVFAYRRTNGDAPGTIWYGPIRVGQLQRMVFP